MDHAGLVDTKSRNKCPTRPRYKPSANSAVSSPDRRLTQACPANVMRVSAVRTASEGTTPTAAPARTHQLARTIHDSRLPPTDTAGRPPPPPSMNKPAVRNP